jgi:hypothetical protein
MRLDFHFDTEQDDAQLIKDVCAVLAGVSVKTDVIGPAESKSESEPARQEPEPARQEPEPARQVESQTAPKEETKETPTRKVQPYDLSEDELKALPTDVLLDMLKDLGVDPDKFFGKNTNKKLRDLILSCSDGVRPQEPSDDDDEGLDEGKVPVAGEAHAPMTYEQAKPLVSPLWRDFEKKKIIQGIMVKHGCVKEEGGVKRPQFAAFEAIGKDYRAMVEEIINYKYE